MPHPAQAAAAALAYAPVKVGAPHPVAATAPASVALADLSNQAFRAAGAAPAPMVGSMAVYATKMALYDRLPMYEAQMDALQTIAALLKANEWSLRNPVVAIEVVDQIDDVLLALDESGYWPAQAHQKPSAR